MTTSGSHLRDHCSYRYDATGRLRRVIVPGLHCERFCRGGRAVNELRTWAGETSQVTWLHTRGQPIVEQVEGHVVRTALLGTTMSGSVLMEADAVLTQTSYSPHGYHAAGEDPSRPGGRPTFNGELWDAASGCYLLGAGHHRPYRPGIGMFLAPDRASPFRAGGLNAYAYCGGDPVNRTDPTGHFWKWIIAGGTLALSVVAVAATAGTGLGVLVGAVALTKTSAAAAAGTTLGVAAIGVEVGALVAHEVGAERAGNILGWVGLGLGAVGMAVAAPALIRSAGKAASKLASRASRFEGRTDALRLSRHSGATVAGGRSSVAGSSSSGVSLRSQASSASRRHSRTSLSSMGSSGSGGSLSDEAMSRLQALVDNGRIRARTLGNLDATEMAETVQARQIEAERWWRSKSAPYTTREWGAASGDRVALQQQSMVNADEHLNVARLVPEEPATASGILDHEGLLSRFELPEYEAPPAYPGLG